MFVCANVCVFVFERCLFALRCHTADAVPSSLFPPFLSLSLALFQDCASPHKSSRGVSQTFCSAVAPRLLPSTPPLHSKTKSPLSLVLTIHWSCFDCGAKRFAAFSSSFVISEAVKLFVFHFFTLDCHRSQVYCLFAS